MKEVEQEIERVFKNHEYEGIEDQETLNEFVKAIYDAFNIPKSEIVVKKYHEKLVESIKDESLIYKLNEFWKKYNIVIISKAYLEILGEQILQYMGNGDIQIDFFSNVIITLIKEFKLLDNNRFIGNFISKLIQSVVKQYENDLSLKGGNGHNADSLYICTEAFENAEKIIEFLMENYFYDYKDIVIVHETKKIDDYLIKSFFEYCFLKHSKGDKNKSI